MGERRHLHCSENGRLYQQADVVQYRDMLVEIEGIVQDMMTRIISLQQIEEASPCLAYQRQYGRDSGEWTTNVLCRRCTRV